jgi:hypothetical protein
MTFFMFKNLIATLILSTQFVTVLSLPDPITSISSGAGKLDLFIKRSPDNKTLVLKPLVPKIDTNMVILTEGGSYNFLLKMGGAPHKFIEIKKGTRDSIYKTLKVTGNFKILEGPTSIRLINTSKRSLKIGERTLKGKSETILPKGPPIFINGIREAF